MRVDGTSDVMALRADRLNAFAVGVRLTQSLHSLASLNKTANSNYRQYLQICYTSDSCSIGVVDVRCAMYVCMYDCTYDERDKSVLMLSNDCGHQSM